MTFQQIMQDLKNRIYHPVYFLCGEEPYYIDEISRIIENHVLEESERDFNQTIVYGRDVSAEEIISMAKRYPMMASHQVVVVKEGQNLENIENLLPYIEHPLESTLLVIHFKYRKVDNRKKFFKVVKDQGVLFESKKLYGNQVEAWIREYVESRGYGITPKAELMLKDFLGVSLTKIVNEVNKILINMDGAKVIDDELIEKYIGISKDFNIFELQNAIGRRDITRAHQIIFYFASNKKENPLMRNLIILYGFFVKIMKYHQLKDKSNKNIMAELGVSFAFINDYKRAASNYPLSSLIRIIGYLREYDLKLKGVNFGGASEGELMKELVYKIMH